MNEIYAALCEPFADRETFKLPKGNTELTYVTAEAVTTRLNATLGVDGWSFDVLEHGHDEQHVWVLGKLTVYFPERTITRSQFGECARNAGMAIGDARKGACSDSVKKAASLFGVGLYLAHREDRSMGLAAPPPRTWDTDGNVVAGNTRGGYAPAPVSGYVITCETCGEEMHDTQRNDGTVWLASEKAEFSRRKYQGRVLCYGCSRTAG